MSNTDWRAEYLDRCYRSRRGWINGTTEFHNLLSKYIHRDSSVLELGAGCTNPTSEYLASISREVVGLDIDRRVQSNTFLTKAYMYQGSAFPFPDSMFDAVVSNYVNEHLLDPEEVCREVNQVLKNGKSFIFRTPNLFHYVGLAARLMPHGVKRRLARLRVLGKETPGHFPTYYRMNTPRRLKSLLQTEGFEIEELALVEKEPSYGIRSQALFFLFLLYERLVNSSQVFARFRANIFCVATKVGSPKSQNQKMTH